MKKKIAVIVIIVLVLGLIGFGVYDSIGDTVYEGNMTGLAVGIRYASTASGDADFVKANGVIRPKKNTVEPIYYNSFKSYWGKNFLTYASGKKTAQQIFNAWVSQYKKELSTTLDNELK